MSWPQAIDGAVRSIMYCGMVFAFAWILRGWAGK